MYLLIFLHSTDQFLKAFQIDEVICIELLTTGINYNRELTRIVTLVILYGSCRNINSHSPYISNSRDGPPKYTKYYLRNYLEETSIQENGYPLYRRCNNGSTYEIPHFQDRNQKFTMDNYWVI